LAGGNLMELMSLPVFNGVAIAAAGMMADISHGS